MNLTEHFTLEEMIATQVRYIDNTPSPEIIKNLRETARHLEYVRKILHAPVLVSSGYRCDALNRAIGGSETSRHKLGLAADFIAPQFGSPYAVCVAIIASPLQFDQLIFEHTWVHYGLSLPGEEPRLEVLTLTGRGTYAKGLKKKSDDI